MACRLSGAKPLYKPMLIIVNWTLRNKLQWNFNRNSNIFIHENALQNVVCEMASNLSRPQCDNWHGSRLLWSLLSVMVTYMYVWSGSFMDLAGFIPHTNIMLNGFYWHPFWSTRCYVRLGLVIIVPVDVLASFYAERSVTRCEYRIKTVSKTNSSHIKEML